MKKNLSTLFVVLLSLSLLLSACGSAPEPIAFSKLPVFTDASESADPALAAGLTSMLDGMKADSATKSSEGKAYDLPEGTTFDAIKSFYSAAMEKDGWSVSSESTAATQVLTREKQIVLVNYLDGIGLIVILYESN